MSGAEKGSRYTAFRHSLAVYCNAHWLCIATLCICFETSTAGFKTTIGSLLVRRSPAKREAEQIAIG